MSEKAIKTGAEIWEIIKHPSISYMEEYYEKDKLYEFKLLGGKNSDGVLNSESIPVLTQEELNAKRIEEIFVELKQVNQDIENYTLVGDTDKVAELEAQRQLLIDEYNTLKG